MTVDPDVFRRTCAYTYDVSKTLLRHKQTLRLIFDELDKMSHTTGALITLPVWRAFLRGLNFVGDDVSERDAKLCFVWSIMCVIDGQTADGFLKETCLPFEGFLEALCRLATLKAFPTDEEIEAAGDSDAGLYMSRLKNEQEDQYETMLTERAGRWGDIPGNQPMHRCIHHMLMMIIRRVEDSEVNGHNTTSDLKISPKEFRQWVERSMKGQKQ
eukprot:CAMPEP_0174751002 /NCGR_PEP_ID=MMETSP1094-20130205/98971_1 /TAXON_ID=156173 /ORGANISM="Chrysochromulina brevifilum, Strain UTEX LB 985" /LENGTH=213 /DNA_ID=CAMNT_0015956429 /DNA_START=56 /DNA_END=697 /DNA_ORIENTATION=+